MTGIVIVTWNSADVIGRCLDACSGFPGVRVVVVDNSSADSTAEVVRTRPGVRLISNTQNRGFAAAANQGIAALDTPTVLLLNPDAVPIRGLEVLTARALQSKVGAAGGELLDRKGQPQHGFNVRNFPTASTLVLEVLGLNRVMPWNPVNRSYRRKMRSAADVDQPAGAFLMINREAWRTVGGFDEAFWPAWFEDVDFCLRLRQAGYRVLYVPEASADHIGGHSASSLTWASRQLFWYGSLLRYSAKHLSDAGRRLVSVAVMLACVPRGIAGLSVSGSFSAVSVYSKVFRLALGYWRTGGRRYHPAARSCVAEGENRSS
jgi:GT2 family glycosyltransferase